MAEAKFRVHFKYIAHYFTKSVEVLGSFNNWKPGNFKLEDDDGDNVWSGSLELPAGRYEYKYLLNGNEYRLDPDNPLQVMNEGFANSLLIVGEPSVMNDAVHTRDFVEIYSEQIVYIKAILQKNLYSDAKLILMIHDTPKSIPGIKLFSDEFNTYYQFKLTDQSILHSFIYYFELVRTDGTIAYLGTTGVVSTEWEVDDFEYYDIKLPLFSTPDWVRDAVFYQIFTDRFYNASKENDPPSAISPEILPKSDSFYGGDLEGVIQKLNHITDLGINSVYFNPVFEASTNHKYDTTDYLKIDPHFGTENTFDVLAETFAKNSIRFILDGVFNHTGRNFHAFRDILENGKQSEYKDWYYIKKFPVDQENPQHFECWWNFPDLPKLNLENPETKKYILNVALEWLRKGSAGWRLDVPEDISHTFWREFRSQVKKEFPNAFILGEIWQNGSPWLQGNEFDAVMNYRFRDACIEFFAKRNYSAEEFVKEMGMQLFEYPMQSNFVLMNLLSSHDTARFNTVAKKDLSRIKLALVFQFTYIGAPSIYYGEEIGMEGGKDPDNRRFMEWDFSKWNQELYKIYKKLIQIRHENEVLRRGDISFLYAKNSIVGFERTLGKNKLVIFINNSDKNIHLDVTQIFGNGDFIDLFRDHPLKRKKNFTLYANDAIILKKTKNR